MNKKEINKHPDGSSYVSVEPHNKGDLPRFTFRINSYEDLWHLNQLVDACETPPIVTLPNLLDAQADRRFNRFESSGLKLILKFLNSMPVFEWEIFHPHNPEVVEYSLNNITIIPNNKFIRGLLQTRFGGELQDLRVAEENLILMSADAGGFKPLIRLCDDIGWRGETYSASKARTDKGMRQLIDRDDFGGKDILIVDDISVGGGTFKGISTLLKDRNVGKLYLAVSHITVQNLGDDPVTNYFDKVFTTNSKFDSYYGKYAEGSDRTVQPKNLEIIKLFKYD